MSDNESHHSDEAPVIEERPNTPESINEDSNAVKSPVGAAKDLYEEEHDSSSPKDDENLNEDNTNEDHENVEEDNDDDKPASIDGDDNFEPIETESNSNRRAVIDSDDEDNEDNNDDEPGPSRKRALIDSDESDNEDSEKKKALSDDSDGEANDNEQNIDKRNLFGDDSDEDDNEEDNNMNNEEDEEKPEDDDDNIERPQGDDEHEQGDDVGRIDSDDEDQRNNGFEWDFDIMMREKKAERKRRVRRSGKDGGIDIINDDDGAVELLVNKMKSAASADRQSHANRRPAFQKVKLLPEVKNMMMKSGVTEALIDGEFMGVISEWLAPLPDKSLPALDIRITLLKLLHNPRFWKLDRSTLKKSGLGKAVMLLYKHPNETKENKMIANKLIGEWARPIFQLDTDYSSMSREERVHRDYERMPDVKRKRLNIPAHDDDEESHERRRPEIRETADLEPTTSNALKPGDKGYINRARVPRPSTRDYVVRPKWNVEGECKERKATGTKRFDQALREFQDRTKKSKNSRAVHVSLEGRNLAI